MASLAAISWQLEATRERLGKNGEEVARSLISPATWSVILQTEPAHHLDLQDEPAAAEVLSEVLVQGFGRIKHANERKR